MRRWSSLLCLTMLACVSAPVARLTDKYCEPPFAAVASELPAAEAIDPRLQGRYTARSLQMAQVIGIAPLLARLEERSGDAGVRAQILERLLGAHLQVGRMVAELDCEGARAAQASGTLRARETDLVRWLTISSVTIGAVAAVLVAILDGRDQSPVAQETIAVAGGTASAGLALGTFLVSQRRVFDHPRNLLSDIWQGPAVSPLYPPAVWKYLTDPRFSNEGVRSIRENIVQRWLRAGQLGDEGTPVRAHRVALFFGRGGEYRTEELSVRVDLLDHLKASVDSMNQELDHLQGQILSGLAIGPA